MCVRHCIGVLRSATWTFLTYLTKTQRSDYESTSYLTDPSI